MRCSVWTMRTKKILRFLSHALSVFMLCSYDSEIIEREGICCLPTYFFIEASDTLSEFYRRFSHMFI